MPREVTIKIQQDIPTTPQAKIYFRTYLKTLREQIGNFGNDGQNVGIGYVWETHTGHAEGGINRVTRRVQRALRTSGILCFHAEPYNLLQKIKYIPDGEPNVTLTIIEDDII